MTPNLTTDQFIKKSQERHGSDKYTFGKTDYINRSTPVTITCKEHGDFVQKPSDHLNGNGCQKCGYQYRTNPMWSPKEGQSFADLYPQYLDEWGDNEHGPEYYTPKSGKPVKRVCRVCNYKWNTKIGIWTMGRGCPYCAMLTPEKTIYNLLSGLNVDFVWQYKGEGCKHKNQLLFDFAIMDKYNQPIGLIEYNGAQHYRPAYGQKKFEVIKVRDSIKRDWAIDNSIPLLTIPYTETHVELMVKWFIKELNA